VGRCTCERRLIRSTGRYPQPLWAAPAWPEGFTMSVRTRVTLCIKVNVAACLFGIAAIIKALM
jgi:hypothetical protein